MEMCFIVLGFRVFNYILFKSILINAYVYFTYFSLLILQKNDQRQMYKIFIYEIVFSIIICTTFIAEIFVVDLQDWKTNLLTILE